MEPTALDFYGNGAVVTDGLQSEYARIRFADSNLIPIPLTHETTSITIEQDCLTISDIFATGWASLDFSGFKTGDTVAVFGAGPVGLLAAYSAVLRDASKVGQPHNVLLTGASGYLGGSLFAGLKSYGLSGYDKIYALVRSDAQKEAVQQYGAEPLSVSLKDAKAVRDVVLQNKISVVFYLIDVFESTAQENLIRALGDLRQTTGQDAHFLHTSGAKIFSSDAGAPTDRELLDTDPNLYDIQKGQKASANILQKAGFSTANLGHIRLTKTERAQVLGTPYLSRPRTPSKQP
ncbi:hypothetical protein K4K54_004140 [Colletotrichum sp. SAR 10_86]|nr:hypothetical protein K4K51_000736 [Colletotrichum sp. SAR 10_75]KAI8225985.1 hypothetical protein K4K54_004140 [Colletotrichum sp. SAR 10_86]